MGPYIPPGPALNAPVYWWKFGAADPWRVAPLDWEALVRVGDPAKKFLGFSP